MSNIKIKDKKLAEKIEAEPISKEEFKEALKKVCKPNDEQLKYSK